MESSFSQKFESLIVSFDGSFRSCLLESSLTILTPGKDLISSYFFVLRLFISRVAKFARWFLRKGIMEPALPDVFDCPLAWSCTQVFNSGLGMRLYEGRFGYLQGVVFMQNFWNFKAFPQTEIILTSIQSRLILKKFKWFLWRGFQMWSKRFVLIFWWKIWSDIWLVTRRLKFQFEG
jgi:hypothetical protein